MTTFQFEKDVGDIEEPKLLDVDWYSVVVSRDVVVSPNEVLRTAVPGDNPPKKALEKACKDDPKAGYTCFIPVKTKSPDEDFDGRELTIMLPFPNKADLTRRDRDGMVLYDAKMQRITQICEKAGGEVEGKSATIAKGMEFEVYVKQRNKRDSSGLENVIDIFAGFRGKGEEGGEEDLEGMFESDGRGGETVDDEVPF